jgi:quinol monooxygenase YgiN
MSRPPALGLLVTLESKPGMQDDVARFLEDGLAAVNQEPGTVTWYAFRMNDTTFGIYDTFHEENGREAHLSGEVAQALGRVADDLLAAPPDIRQIDVIAAKLP